MTGGERRTGALSGQLLRYVIVGGFVTGLQVAVYWAMARWGGVHPQLANVLGYLVAVASGFVLHGRVTFRGHGKRDQPVARAVRFVTVSLLSLALNAFWVWLFVERLALPLWSPVPLMAVVTPAFVFLLNRHWVFR
ncbi:hypothetical membrane protein [Sphingobium sp. SYK-6]|uniref:GtrA family protein n=1 Tax=Sphingobium sp. (strain NBRC 103272 / SYK-6) TaxID=627192 RepID=UPI000227796A|nr:GtrA family protein [Sphingobium sp. SYK-6]BAK68062.1 hypothetical membrane protein [Sphingobium sp. SYK-6]